MRWKIDAAGLTDIGKRRSSNQDQFLIADLSKSMYVEQSSLNVADTSTMFGNSQGKLLLVADGMGGHAAGDKASTVAVGAIATYILNSLPWYFRLDKDRDEDFVDDLKDAVQYSHDRLVALGQTNPEDWGMGTTITLAYVIWPRLFVVHVGDSRCYLIRDDHTECMTRDHTLAAAGDTTTDVPSSASAKMSHVLWNVLGGGVNEEVTVEIHKAILKIGDSLVLCSDGLYNNVCDDRMLSVVQSSNSAQTACRRLVDYANDAGGSDNITAVVARFVSQPDQGDDAIVETQVSLEQLIGDKSKDDLANRNTDRFDAFSQSG